MTDGTDRPSTAAGDPVEPVLVVAFDALDFRFLEAFEGSLPEFAALREAGVEAPLETTFPPITGSAWPSMYTGVGPSRHGVFGFFTYEDYPDSARVVTRNDVRAPALWNYLSAMDVPSVVLNLPVTYPAEPIEGVLVPGDLAPPDADGYPRGVRAELDPVVGGYEIYPDGSRGVPDRFTDLLRARTAAAKHLLAEREWGLAIVQFQVTDTVFHETNDPSAHRAVYAEADRALGELRELLPETGHLLVCSDHGMGPVDGHRTYLNEVLRDHGYLEPSDGGAAPSLRGDRRDALGADEADGDGPGTFASAVSVAVGMAERVGVGPGDVFTVLQRLGLEDAVKRVVPEDVTESVRRGVDWRASSAYCGTASEYGVRLNLDGRESDGVVPREDYEAVRDRIVELLSSLRTPDGDPTFEFVEPREAVYDGPLTGEAPDVLFMPTDANHDVSTELVGRTSVPVDAYNHRREGVFLGAGPRFESGSSPGSMSLTDVAPLAMALLGLDVPERMTGTVPPELLARPVTRREYKGVDFATGNETADGGETSVEDRLRNLGYV
jgi:predicted AlkP superfamily phosphohydrolase/phosphomutase